MFTGAKKQTLAAPAPAPASKSKSKAPKPKARASSSSSAASSSQKKDPRASQESQITQSLKDFHFPKDPQEDPQLQGPTIPGKPGQHIELPPIGDDGDNMNNTVNLVNTLPASKKTPTPGPNSKKSKKSKRSTNGEKRAKLKVLPGRAVRRLRGYGSRLKKRLRKTMAKIKSKRPKGGLKLRVKLEPSEVVPGADGIPGAGTLKPAA